MDQHLKIAEKFNSKTDLMLRDPQLYKFLSDNDPEFLEEIIRNTAQGKKAEKKRKENEEIEMIRRLRNEILDNYKGADTYDVHRVVSIIKTRNIDTKKDYLDFLLENPGLNLPKNPENKNPFESWLKQFELNGSYSAFFEHWDYLYFLKRDLVCPKEIREIEDHNEQYRALVKLDNKLKNEMDEEVIYNCLRLKITKSEAKLVSIICRYQDRDNDHVFKSLEEAVLFVRTSNINESIIEKCLDYIDRYKQVDYKNYYEYPTMTITKAIELITTDDLLNKALVKSKAQDTNYTGKSFGRLSYQYYTYPIFKKIIRENNITSEKEYSDLRDKFKGFPFSPKRVYDRMWEGWVKVLNRQTKESLTFVEYEKAKKIVMEMNIKSRVQYKKALKDKLINLPHDPSRHYGSLFTSWGNFLNTNTIATQKRVYLTYKEANKTVARLGIKTTKEFQERVKINPIEGVPNDPRKFYRDNGWVNWQSFLSGKSCVTKKRNKISYLETKNILQGLKFKTREEYRTYVSKNPEVNLAYHPDRTHSKEWVSWKHFLSLSN